MQVVVRPLVAPQAPPQVLRVWVGVFGYDQLPDLTWRVDGAEAPAPDVVRPLAPAWPDPDRVRSATGVFDVAWDSSGNDRRSLAVRVTATTPKGSASTEEAIRRLPEALSDDPLRSFNVLLVSCFYQRKDKSGRAGALVASLTGDDRPDLVLTVGDQVYLDVPTLNFTSDAGKLAERFDEKYRTNFASGDGYASILRAGPVAALPDDHEYWNNYPHRAAWIPPTWTEAGREAWTTAAKAMYDAYQLGAPGQYCYRFDVPPLSFFMMDNRTFRNIDGRTTLQEADKDAYRAWAQEMCGSHMLPVLVTAPSLLQNAAQGVAEWIDRNIANYADYRDPLMSDLIAMVRAGRPVLALSGDVHYGRVVEAALFGVEPGQGKSFGSVREVIASPASLVAMQKAHTASVPPAEFTPVPGGHRLHLRTVWPRPGADMRGNNLALLKFRRHGTSVRLDVRYLLVGDRPPYRHDDVGPVKLPL